MSNEKEKKSSKSVIQEHEVNLKKDKLSFNLDYKNNMEISYPNNNYRVYTKPILILAF